MNLAQLRNNTIAHRYELINEDEVVGFVEYELAGNAIKLLHTEISPGHEGKGYGSVLARQVLDEVRAQNKRLIPDCEFIAGYIRKHQEYGDLVKSESEPG